MQKKGQVYIIAALIISILVVGLGTVYSYTKSTEEDKSVNYLSREIDYESSRIIDKGVYYSETDLNDKLNAMLKYYAELNIRSELIVVYGRDSSSLTAMHYKLDNAGKVCIQTGSCSGIDVLNKMKVAPPFSVTADNTIEIYVGVTTYKFKLRKGENFYMVLIKEKEGEKFVASPEREI